jgi:hypothetical protein
MLTLVCGNGDTKTTVITRTSRGVEFATRTVLQPFYLGVGLATFSKVLL